MNRITICENVMAPEAWEYHESEDVCKFLKDRYGKWPPTAKIYLNYVCESADVTPCDEAGVTRLQGLSGNFFVVIWPAEPMTIFIIVAIAVSAIAIGLSFLLRPNIPNVKNQQESSPNNQLTTRQNKERPNERIPDIFGQLLSTPDLIAVPYRIFVSNVEIEHSYMCIGRGSYTVFQVRDDLTPISEIDGSSVEVYGPNSSPNSGTTPQLRIGTAIGTPIKTIRPLSSVNGQVLIAPNLPATDWVGPFIIGDVSTTEIWVNFVAEQGSYQIPSSTGVQAARSTTLRVGLTPTDGAGTATGSETTHDITLTGSASSKNRIGVTLKITGLSGIYSMRASRITNTNIAANISVADEVQWRDAMSVAPVSETHFGDVTTIQTLTLPTPQALALKARKLNMLVCRNIPIGTLASGAVTFASPGPTKSAADVIMAICQDEKIGNRALDELETVHIYETIDEIETYFGTDLATQFCYTFDDSKVSFEESLADIAASIFCTAFRRGSVIDISFEKLTPNSTFLFNHRNKIPASETRTFTFGSLNSYDGIEFNYIEPNAPNFPNVDTPVTLYYPTDRSAINAKKVTSVGIRNNVQAHFLAARLYNKLRYQNTITQFQATKEASMCIINNRILVADNTRPDTQDGEVVSADGLTLMLSQPVVFVGGRSYTIFLQHYDATIEAIAITAGINERQVILGGATTLPLVTDQNNFARTTYVIVDDSITRSAAFLVAEKSPQDGQIFELKATNYDSRYYDQDTDFIEELVIWNGPEGGQGVPISTGEIYLPTITNDIGVNPSSSLTNTSGVVQGHYDPFADPDPISQDGDCIWSGFPAISLTAPVTLHVQASHNGSLDTMTCQLILAGTTVFMNGSNVGSTAYSVTIPAGTYLNSITVEAIALGNGTSSHIRTSNVTITDIYIQ